MDEFLWEQVLFPLFTYTGRPSLRSTFHDPHQETCPWGGSTSINPAQAACSPYKLPHTAMSQSMLPAATCPTEQVSLVAASTCTQNKETSLTPSHTGHTRLREDGGFEQSLRHSLVHTALLVVCISELTWDGDRDGAALGRKCHTSAGHVRIVGLLASTLLHLINLDGTKMPRSAVAKLLPVSTS